MLLNYYYFFKALAQLRHDNIIGYYHSWIETPPPGWQEKEDQTLGIGFGSCEEESSPEGCHDGISYLFIQMELCQKDTLEEWL